MSFDGLVEGFFFLFIPYIRGEKEFQLPFPIRQMSGACLTMTALVCEGLMDFYSLMDQLQQGLLPLYPLIIMSFEQMSLHSGQENCNIILPTYLAALWSPLWSLSAIHCLRNICAREIGMKRGILR